MLNNILSISGGLWKPSPVDQVPTLELASWTVYEVLGKDGVSKEYHFVGYNITEYEGRVSSKIINYDKESKTGVTRSGRQYILRGESGFNSDAAYVWNNWCSFNKVNNFIDVSKEFTNQS